MHTISHFDLLDKDIFDFLAEIMRAFRSYHLMNRFGDAFALFPLKSCAYFYLHLFSLTICYSSGLERL